MTSTRNKNSIGDYKLEQRDYLNGRLYLEYERYATPQKVAFPVLGIRPTFMSRDTFSSNAIDIESMLRGTNSTNLVNPDKKPIQPNLRYIPEINYFDRLPVLMPNPLVIEDRQRPGF
jgi:hypothetical protein